MSTTRRYLIKTDYGDVLAELDETPRNVLDGPIFSLSLPDEGARDEAPFEVPLRAFSAKMVDVIEIIGTGDFRAEPKVLELLKREKATEELTRIERWAKQHAG